MKTSVKCKLKERWQKQREEERTGRWLYRIQRKAGMTRSTGRTRREETIISRLRFGQTRLNSTIQEDVSFAIKKKTLEHIILYCPEYDAERRELILNLKEIKMNYDFRDLLQRSSGERCYPFLFQYLRRTRLIERENIIVFIFLCLFVSFFLSFFCFCNLLLEVRNI